MKYELFKITTNESLNRVQEFSDAPPDLAHKDMEWRVYVEPQAPAETAEQIRNRLKWERTLAVDAITVTTQAGNNFDGNEISQDRMDRAAASLVRMDVALAEGNPIILPPEVASIYRVVNDKHEIVWVLADNTPKFVSAAELYEALTLSGAAQTAIWAI